MRIEMNKRMITKMKRVTVARTVKNTIIKDSVEA